MRQAKMVMKQRQNILKFVIFLFLATASSMFAVTEQQIQQMRQAMPSRPIVEPAKPRTMLVFSLCNGFQHDCIPYWAKALDIMGETTGAFKVVRSTDMGVFTRESLSRFDVICFNNTTKLVPDAAQQQAIMEFISSGKGIVGIHAATDNFDNWPQGAMMMGGLFKGHPWMAEGTWAVKLDDPDHPLMQSFKGEGFKVNDEIYRTLPPEYNRQNQRVLMSLDMSDPTTKEKAERPEDRDTGISWIKPVGEGRLFYCSLGHNIHLTWNKDILWHYLAGIQYAAGDLKVDDSPLGYTAENTEAAEIRALIPQIRGFEWDGSRAVLYTVQEKIRSCYGNEEALGTIEEMLLDVLESDSTAAAKDFACRQLAVIGTNKSVPMLSKMLADPKTSDMARYALEKIPARDVDDVLVKATKAAPNQKVLIGIISTLGNRKSDKVISLAHDLFSNADNGDEAVNIALLSALGSVGTEESVEELFHVRPNLTGQAQKRCTDALLMCADAMLAANQRRRAIEIYDMLYKEEKLSIVRAAALSGLAQAGSQDIQALLPNIIQMGDMTLRTAAIQSLAYVNDDMILETTVSKASDLPADAQIQLLTVLSENAREGGEMLALQMVRSEQQPVRIAAYEALAKIGDISAIEILAGAAAQAQDRDEREAAREALSQIPGKSVDSAILEKIAASMDGNSDEKVVIELIRATASRGIDDASEVLFRTAEHDNQKIASESVRALQSLAGPEHAEALVNLVVSRPGADTENMLLVVAEKFSSHDQVARLILDKYGKIAGNEDARVSLLRVLGKLGDSDAIALIKSEYASSNEKLQEAAFRAMTDWPQNDFIGKMKTLARSAEDEKTRILAFRAYIRMLTDSGKNEQGIVDELIAAYSLAERPDERKYVIGVLGNYGNEKALKFVKDKVAEPDLKAEVQVSLLQICEKLRNERPSAVNPVLRMLKENGSSESVRNRAEELLK
jgi:type 1 glutamine amidotransferase